MKPRDLIACFFAGYGVYLVVISLLGVLSAAAMIAATLPSGLYGSFRSTLLLSLIPMSIGVLLAVISRRLAEVAARLAGVDPDANWNVGVPATSLLAIVIAVLGVYLVVTRAAEVIRALGVLFAANAGGTIVGRGAAMQIRPWSETIPSLVCIVAGVYLASRCSAIAARILPGADRE